MTHDKIKDAARARMAETGENYTTARRAVIAEHAAKADGGGLPGTTPALEPSTEPNPPLTAAAASALLAKEIG